MCQAWKQLFSPQPSYSSNLTDPSAPNCDGDWHSPVLENDHTSSKGMEILASHRYQSSCRERQFRTQNDLTIAIEFSVPNWCSFCFGFYAIYLHCFFSITSRWYCQKFQRISLQIRVILLLGKSIGRLWTTSWQPWNVSFCGLDASFYAVLRSS